MAAVRSDMTEPANSFRAVVLSEDDAAQTLPLAQVTWPDVDLPHWRKYIRSYAASSQASSGIVALRDAGAPPPPLLDRVTQGSSAADPA